MFEGAATVRSTELTRMSSALAGFLQSACACLSTVLGPLESALPVCLPAIACLVAVAPHVPFFKDAILQGIVRTSATLRLGKCALTCLSTVLKSRLNYTLAMLLVTHVAAGPHRPWTKGTVHRSTVPNEAWI